MEPLLHKYMSTTSLPPINNAVKSLTASSWLPSGTDQLVLGSPLATSSLPEKAHLPPALTAWWASDKHVPVHYYLSCIWDAVL